MSRKTSLYYGRGVLLSLIISLLLNAIAVAQEGKTIECIEAISPARPYIGDRVTVVLTFTDNEGVLKSLFTNSDKLDLTRELASKASSDIEIVSASLNIGKEEQYRLEIVLIPWVIGSLNLGEIVLPNKGTTSPTIATEPITCYSILEDTGNLNSTGIGAISPKLIPGTVYMIYVAIILLCLMIFAIVIALIHLKDIRVKVNTFIEQLALKGFTRRLLKELTSLRNKDIGDGDFARVLEETVRHYLTRRYYMDFSTVETSRLYSVFSRDLSFELLGEGPLDHVIELTGIMTRLDYIRYAKGSLDSTRAPVSFYSTTLTLYERESIIGSVIDFIDWSISCAEGAA